MQLPSRSCGVRAVTHFSKGPCPDGEAVGDGGLAIRSWVLSKACCEVRQARVRRAGADRSAFLVWSDGGTPVDTTPACTRAYAHFSRALFTRDNCTCGSRLFSVARFLKHSHLSVMSLLGVPVSRFCPIASSPTCSLSRHSASSTPLAGTRSASCVSARWSGMSGCLANPTPAPPSSSPDSNRSFPRNYDATKVSTTEDPDGPQHSGASSSNRHTAASRVPTALGSFGNRLWKQLADYESVDSRNDIQETGANSDKESVVATLFWSESKVKTDRDQNVVRLLGERESKSSQNP